MFDLTFKNVDSYGIKQSSWNSLFQLQEYPKYFYSDKKYELEEMLRKYFKINSEDCEWNFNDIGWHTYDSGFFGKDYYISCANCDGGKVNGSAKAKIAKVKIIKESGNPSSPKDGLFSTDILEEKFVLWNLTINAKCNRCDNKSVWTSISTEQNDKKAMWNFEYFSEYFSKL